MGIGDAKTNEKATNYMLEKCFHFGLDAPPTEVREYKKRLADMNENISPGW